MAQVTEEMVEKGAKAMWDAMCWKSTWEDAPERDKRNWRDDTRAALESVADDLRAEGMREAAEIALVNKNFYYLDASNKVFTVDVANCMADKIAASCRARANQLSPTSHRPTQEAE